MLDLDNKRLEATLVQSNNQTQAEIGMLMIQKEELEKKAGMNYGE